MMTTSDPGLTVEDQVRLIARDEANKLLLSHLQLCPFVSNEIEKRTRTLEKGMARVIGFAVGSGLIGGVGSTVISKIIN